MSTSPDYFNSFLVNFKKRWVWVLVLPAWVMLSFFASQIIIAIFYIVFQSVLELIFSDVIINLIIEALSYTIMIFLIMAVPWAINKKNTVSKIDLGINRLPKWRELIVSPGGLIIYFVLSSLLMIAMSKICPWIDFDQAQDTGFNGLSANYEYLIAFVALVVIAPFAEELIFRGYLFSRLKKYAPVWLAIIITSLVFGAAHMAWNVAIDTFALSVVACVLREMFGSIWPSILIHMMKNGLAYYLLFINPDLLTKLVG